MSAARYFDRPRDSSLRWGYSTSAMRTITVIDNEGASGPKAIDTPNFFVGTHNLDFFAREPDSAGLAYRTNEITPCVSNQH